MRRFALLLSVVAVLLLGITSLGGQLTTRAQEATPSSNMGEEGVTLEPAAFAPGIDLASPSDLIVERMGLEPGAVHAVVPDVRQGILLVDSGTFTIQVEGPMMVTRGAGLGEAMATAEASGDVSGLMEYMPAGQVVTLDAGDAAYIPGNVSGEIRNEGRERATALTFIVSSDTMSEATPAP